ncbi:Thiol-disulfide oxidoreductase ResA [Pseudoalteromonas sp. P1-9]|uniref:peroxiredoxin-like family protein n=1 Tax=Pseudoalteromonas sp. P1-9 TaxID=1710354 RepID=UPI0006D61AC9|nr:peroxiredoxin-like family protein [Pseudoalteromonas sp. P1-9]KPV98362.1 Thiol-disulfide oxidoreductase ResA [Pseudoalteromonas sp. P1-9]
MSSLSKKLASYKSDFKTRTPVEILETINRSISLFQEHSALKSVLKVGQTFPSFELADINGQLFNSKELIQDKPLILTFVRGGWCPYCVLETQMWQQYFEKSKSTLNIVAITPEKPEFAKSMQSENNLSFPLLFDSGLCFAELLGLVWKTDDAMKQQLLKWDINLTERHCTQTFNLPVPATFVIDNKEVIQYRFIEEDYSSRAEPDDVLAIYNRLI